MLLFDFVTHKDLRSSLEADYKEIKACREAYSWKAVHVLAGNIIEAVLVDYLIVSDYQKRAQKDPLQLTFADLISICRSEKIISQKAADLCNVVKHYRNLIHPGRCVRLKEKVDEPGAKVAEALVEIIVNEISALRSKQFGYTAEQVVSKIERDASVTAIFNHLLDGMPEYELERLLVEVLPQKYVELSTYPYASDNRVSHSLQTCFRRAHSKASTEIRAKVAKRYVEVLKEEDGLTVHCYGKGLFKAIDMADLSKQEESIVKTHLALKLKEDGAVEWLQSLEGIGVFVNTKEISDFFDPIIKTLIWNKSEDSKEKAREFIRSEVCYMSAEVRKGLIDRIADWVIHFEEQEQRDFSDVLRDLKSSIEVITDDIPY